MTRRAGFTLVELVVVVVVIGILAAVAVPKLLRMTDTATETGLLQDLAVVRDAIELHTAQNGGKLPGDAGTEADFKADLARYIRKFPANPVKNSAAVDVRATGAAFAGAVGTGEGWRYDNKSGQFIANSNSTSSDGVRRYWEL